MPSFQPCRVRAGRPPRKRTEECSATSQASSSSGQDKTIRKQISAAVAVSNAAPASLDPSPPPAPVQTASASSNACEQESADESSGEVHSNSVYPDGSGGSEGEGIHPRDDQGFGMEHTRKDNTRNKKGSGVREPVAVEDIPVSDKAKSSQGATQKKSKYGRCVSASAIGNGGRKRSSRSVTNSGPEASNGDGGGLRGEDTVRQTPLTPRCRKMGKAGSPATG